MNMQLDFCSLRVAVLLVLLHNSQCHDVDEACPLKLDGDCIVNLHGKSGDAYYTEILVGTPPQKLNALIDTGSSNVAVAATPSPQIAKFFNSSGSSTLRPLQVSLDVPYSQGSWQGRLVSDVVQLSETRAPVVRCDVALIEQSKHFYINGSEWQGIVGLAYQQIALPTSSATTWLEAARHEWPDHMDSVSVVLCGPRASGRHHGYIEFGRTRAALVTGPFFSAAILRPRFYEITVTNVTVGDRRLLLPCVQFNTDKTIVDTGTTNLRLPQKVFSEVVAVLQAAAASLADRSHWFWTGKGRLCFPAGNATVPWDLFPNITLSLQIDSSSAFDLTITSQSYLRETFDGEPAQQRCFKLGIDASTTGAVLGVVVLEGLYVRFNVRDSKVEFASSVCGPAVTLSGPYDTVDSSECGYVPGTAYGRTLHVAMYVVGGMLVLICIPLLVVAGSCLKSRPWRRPARPNFSLLVDYRE